MKTLLTILVAFCVINISGAQNFIPKSDLNRRNNNFGLKPPDFKSIKLFTDSLPSLKFSGNKIQLPKIDGSFFTGKLNRAEFRMPVAARQFYSNMPVAVPGSSVNFAVKVKKITYNNPLEYKRILPVFKNL